MMVYADNREHMAPDASMRAFYVAEAGLNHAIAELRSGGDGAIGPTNSPVSFGNGSCHVLSATDGNQVTLVSVAQASGVVRAIEGALSLTTESPYQEAAFGGDGVLSEDAQ